jgi:lysophospholipase L1-like esterase
MTKPIPIDILLVGSSIIQKWNTLQNFLPPSIKIVNLGMSAFTSADMFDAHYIQLLSKYNPVNIIYYCGSNDIRKNIDPRVVIRNIEYFFINIFKKIYGPNVNIIFISIIQNPVKSIYKKNIDIVNYYTHNNIIQFSKKFYISFLDITEDLHDTKYFYKDNIHLNKSGYQKLNEKIIPLLRF